MSAVCISRNVKRNFWRDLLWVLFVCIEMLKVALERPAFVSVSVHSNVICSFWRDLFWVLFVYTLILKVAFGKTCVVFCLCTS